MKHYTLMFSGSYDRGADGIAGYGYALRGDAGLKSGSGSVVQEPGGSVHSAAFQGLVAGMEALIPSLDGTSAHLQVYSSNEVVINLMNKRSPGVPSAKYYSGYLIAMALLKVLRSRSVRVSFDWVPKDYVVP